MKRWSPITSLALLEKYPTAKHYEYASVDRILKTFRGIKENNFNAAKAQKLLDIAKNSIYSGAAKEGRAVMIRSNIVLIRTLLKQIEETEEAMVSLFEPQDEVSFGEQEVMSDIIDNLRTIPGVSDKTILALLAECGNLDRFHSHKALTGLYPTLEQSGNTTRHGRLAKRGANLAKRAIYLAAVAAIRHNAESNRCIKTTVAKAEPKKSLLSL